MDARLTERAGGGVACKRRLVAARVYAGLDRRRLEGISKALNHRSSKRQKEGMPLTVFFTTPRRWNFGVEQSLRARAL